MSIAALAGIFFLSGFPALTYQLLWQRSLFTLYGINVEAVAVVVTGFMLGLGFGSLAGGALSTRFSRHQLLLFGVIELCIGAIGLTSLTAIDLVGAATVHLSSSTTAFISLALLLLPTMLMGATLPILVDYLVMQSGNVGRSVGLLYFVNTCGSSVACFVSALWMMGALGMDGSLRVAAGINFLVGGGALLAYALTRRQANGQRTASSASAAKPFIAHSASSPPADRGRFAFALLLAAMTGLLALSYEILWFRVISIGGRGTSAAFSLMLGAYLGGIGIGSMVGRRCCHDWDATKFSNIQILIGFMLAGSCLGFGLIPIAATAAEAGFGPFAVVALALIGIHGLLSGAIFPLISHYGITAGEDVGARLSFLYLANIIGSAVGSLGTGFFIIDAITLTQLSALLAMGGGAIVAALCLTPGVREQRPWITLATASVFVISVPFLAPRLYHQIYEKLILMKQYAGGDDFDIVENRSGVVAVEDRLIVYGGGAYEGRVNTDVINNVNGLTRPLSISLYHPAPRRTLMIGLATGAWAEVIAGNPDVDELTVVEINKGYLDLIARYPAVADVLRNPKISIVINDGRKWLNLNPNAKFDVVVQNTMLHWRGNSTNLLSAEYIKLVMAHLKKDGIFLYNTTESARAQRTACALYPNSLQFNAMMVVSEAPISIDPERYRRSLEGEVIDGANAFDLSKEEHRQWLQSAVEGADPKLIDARFPAGTESCAHLMARTKGLDLITDRNMGEEWVNNHVVNDPIITRIRGLFN
jgi:spermidine synthase